MRSTVQKVVVFAIKASNVFFLLMPIIYIWEKKYAMQIEDSIKHSALIISIIFVVVYIMFGRTYDGFLISTTKLSESVLSQGLAVLLTDIVIYLVSILVLPKFNQFIHLRNALFIQIGVVLCWSVLSKKIYFKMFPAKKTAIICESTDEAELFVEIYEMKKKFDVIAIEEIDVCINNLDVIKDMQAIFLYGVNSHARNIILKYCVINKIRIYMIPKIADVLMSGAKQTHLFHLPILRVEGYNPSMQYLLTKRLIDIFVAVVALIILSPIMIATAIAIKLYDGGPVFYKQCRLTKDGRKFDIIKFRSMCQNAESDGIARLSTGNEDKRITPIGKFIRNVRIDELPQLLNILEGSMTLVGPRPERPEIARQYEEKIPEFRMRLQVKAGLTGYAQVYGKYNTDPCDKLLMDLMYIANVSILEDIKIMLVTMKILFTKESTEGITTGKITALGQEEVEEKNG